MHLISNLAIAVCLTSGLLLFVVLSSLEESKRRSRATRNIQKLIADASASVSETTAPLAENAATVAVQDDISGLVMQGSRIRLVDLRDEGSLIQSFELSQIRAMKIYESKRNEVPFRLVTHNGAETRLIHASGVSAISRLYTLLLQSGVHLEFVPEAL